MPTETRDSRVLEASGPQKPPDPHFFLPAAKKVVDRFSVRGYLGCVRVISPAKRRETSFSLKARKEPGERPTREGRKGTGKAAKLEGARNYRWEAVAEITRTLFCLVSSSLPDS